MVCPYCQTKTNVKNSRPQKRQSAIWRRRFCSGCQTTFTTQERFVSETVIVVSDRAGRVQPLSEATIITTITNALGTTTATDSQATSLSQTCLAKIFQTGQAKIDQKEMETIVYKTLSNYDPNAGLRYLTDSRVSLDLDDVGR